MNDLPSIDWFVRRIDTTGDCWIWTGGKSGIGYGQVSRGDRRMLAHRVSHLLFVGPIPDGYVVRHRCDNPPCVRPSHLEVGTQLDNMRDKVARGRQAQRSRNGASKLTEEGFDRLIEMKRSGVPQVAIARELGVTPQAVCQYLKRHPELVTQ